jgi:hypothetical protein
MSYLCEFAVMMNTMPCTTTAVQDLVSEALRQMFTNQMDEKKRKHLISGI